MKNFRPHQRVVFTIARLRVPREIYELNQPNANLPLENEIVTIKAPHPIFTGFWILKEYPTGKNGGVQAISEVALFPIEDIHEKLTDEILAGIEKSLYKIHSPLKPELI